MSVRRAQREIDSREFTEWMAFWEMNPFGPDVESWRMGLLMSVVANLFRGKGKRPMRPEDFTPKAGAKRKQTAEEMKTLLKVFTIAQQTVGAGARPRI